MHLGQLFWREHRRRDHFACRAECQRLLVYVAMCSVANDGQRRALLCWEVSHWMSPILIAGQKPGGHYRFHGH
jgi:hypothetical protein